MTNFHIKPPDASLPRFTWQEKKEQRKKLLEEIRHRRAKRYRQFLQNMRLKATEQ